MRLFRFAEVAYASALPESWSYFSYESGAVRVAFRGQGCKDKGQFREHLVSAEVNITPPATNSDVFRNLVLASMRDAGFQPEGMRRVIDEIVGAK
jgi:hypothetical protein